MRYFTLAALCLCSLSLVQCGTNPECTTSSECATGLACIQGACTEQDMTKDEDMTPMFFKLEITDGQTPTDAGGERLFDLKITQAPFALDPTKLTAQIKRVAQNARLHRVEIKTDANSDGLLDVGDVLSVLEPNSSTFGPSDIGQGAQVELFESQSSEMPTLIFTDFWIP